MAVTVGETTADARAEELAIGEVLLVGVVLPPPVAIPIMASRAKACNGNADLVFFFHWRSS